MEHRDDDEDDDVSFAKWMSSFWGHSWRDKDERGPRDHHRPQEASYRKASLPCPFPAFPSITSPDCLPRRHSHEDQGSRSHLPIRYHRKYSVDGSFKEPVESQKGVRCKLQESSESFEQHSPSSVMGSFKGHALPGAFFIIMGFWWNIKSILKYVYKKQTRTCYLSSKTLIRRAEIWEGVVSIFMALTGVIGEQFTAGGPSLTLLKDGQWYQLLEWHHTTMYFFFGLQGVVQVLCFTTNLVPVSLSKLMLSNAIFVESFIFYNHTHGREILDIFVHQLLVFITILAGLVAFLEFLTKNNVLLELVRSTLIILQGTWFWQIGFVLYPLDGSPAWNQTDIENKMFLTMCFSWHYASIYFITGLNYAFITWLVKYRLRKVCTSEVGLLKNAECEHESEEEV